MTSRLITFQYDAIKAPSDQDEIAPETMFEGLLGVFGKNASVLYMPLSDLPPECFALRGMGAPYGFVGAVATYTAAELTKKGHSKKEIRQIETELQKYGLCLDAYGKARQHLALQKLGPQ